MTQARLFIVSGLTQRQHFFDIHFMHDQYYRADTKMSDLILDIRAIIYSLAVFLDFRQGYKIKMCQEEIGYLKLTHYVNSGHYDNYAEGVYNFLPKTCLL